MLSYMHVQIQSHLGKSLRCLFEETFLIFFFYLSCPKSRKCVNNIERCLDKPKKYCKDQHSLACLYNSSINGSYKNLVHIGILVSILTWYLAVDKLPEQQVLPVTYTLNKHTKKEITIPILSLEVTPQIMHVV